MRGYAVAALAALTIASGRGGGFGGRPTAPLPGLVEEAWRAANSYRVSGVVPAMPAGVAAWFERERPGIDELRAVSTRFIWQTTELTDVSDLVAYGDRASATVLVESRFGMDTSEGAPDETWGEEELRFRFRWSGGGWVLLDVERLGKG